MFSSLNRYWIFLFLMILGYGLFEYYRPKPLDWRDTYSNKDNIPFGTEVLFRLMPEIMGTEKIESLRIPPYNHLSGDSARLAGPYAGGAKSSYVFINGSFKADLNDQKALLNYAKNGNTVFIASYQFPGSLMRLLGVAAREHKPTLKDTAKHINFTNPVLRNKKGYLYTKDDGRNYLTLKPASKATVLAVNEDNEPVFVKIMYGKGQVFIHNLPLAFTNYYVLDTLNGSQAFQALSYLPKQPVYWDEYQKQGRFGENENSAFRYIVSQPALKMAYLLTLAGLFIYVIFSGKRKQRIIPVMAPAKNVSLEFVKTIGNMYYRKGDHTNMAEKLIQHFWVYIRERFGISVSRFSESELLEQIAAKSGFSNQEMQIMFNEIAYSNRKWTGSELLELNKKLEDFYTRTR